MSLSEEHAALNSLLASLLNPTKEMLDAGMMAAEDCKDSGWDSGGDGESYNSYEYYTSDAPSVIFKAMVRVALEQAGLPSIDQPERTGA